MLFRKAAEQSHVDSQCVLGMMYKDGIGVRRDYTEAMKWLRMAAEANNGTSQMLLGLMYIHGEGVPANQRKAMTWFHKAVGNGCEEAKHCVEIYM